MRNNAVRGRLTDGFRDIIEFNWTEFIEMERSETATNFDSIVCSLTRAASKGNLRAIQMALDRLDGKIATELEIEMPKFYTLYPMATKAADDPSIIEGEPVENSVKTIESIVKPEVEEKKPETIEELPTGSIREVLDRMLDAPRVTPAAILEAVDQIDQGKEAQMNPKVKSVIVAGLMKLVHDGRMSAVFEVFDQIDGKVAEKLKMLGKDVYTRRYDLIAPAGAVRNEDGIYQIEAEAISNVWLPKLQQLSERNGR